MSFIPLRGGRSYDTHNDQMATVVSFFFLFYESGSRMEDVENLLRRLLERSDRVDTMAVLARQAQTARSFQ